MTDALKLKRAKLMLASGKRTNGKYSYKHGLNSAQDFKSPLDYQAVVGLIMKEALPTMPVPILQQYSSIIGK